MNDNTAGSTNMQATTTASPEPPQPQRASQDNPRVKRVLILVVLLVVLAIVGTAAAFWAIRRHNTARHTSSTAATAASSAATSPSPAASSQMKAQGIQLDTAKNYGNKYANGLLPVGDGKYSTSGPKQGYVYTCSQYAHNLASEAGGAQTRGPWFTSSNTMYDTNKKVHVQGSVLWQGSLTDATQGNKRIITTNDLPDHPTGVFPIAAADPAYAYDRNPNHIAAQSLTYTLDANPSYGSPTCMGGEAGVMLNGVALFNAFDAGGRDAGAWEVQDGCSGHPQSQSEYHYHTLSSCIKDTSVHTVIGFALDGFPITGPLVGPNNALTTSDLDECHGLTSSIMLDGKQVTMYHYVMTQDFPYSVSCFRGTAIQPPGMGQQPGHTP
jgi:hypothetical protein